MNLKEELEQLIKELEHLTKKVKILKLHIYTETNKNQIEREIKFRAWFGGLHNEKMVYDYEGTYYFESYGFYTEEIPIMQYTGLTDKNGKEIYEGDIITTDKYICIDEGKQNYVLLVEIFNCASFITAYCVNKNKAGISDGITEIIDVDEEYTILGNIYENPELLEKK